MKIKKTLSFTLVVLLLAAALPILLCGCAKKVTHEELRQIELRSQGNTFPASIWYMGSKNGYDYFHAGFTNDTNSFDVPMHYGVYKVVSKETYIAERFELTTDRSRWRRHPAFCLEESPESDWLKFDFDNVWQHWEWQQRPSGED